MPRQTEGWKDRQNDGWKDGGTDRPYFTGPSQLPPGVQKTPGDIYHHFTQVYQKS